MLLLGRGASGSVRPSGTKVEVREWNESTAKYQLNRAGKNQKLTRTLPVSRHRSVRSEESDPAVNRRRSAIFGTA